MRSTLPVRGGEFGVRGSFVLRFRTSATGPPSGPTPMRFDTGSSERREVAIGFMPGRNAAEITPRSDDFQSVRYSARSIDRTARGPEPFRRRARRPHRTKGFGLGAISGRRVGTGERTIGIARGESKRVHPCSLASRDDVVGMERAIRTVGVASRHAMSSGELAATTIPDLTRHQPKVDGRRARRSSSSPPLDLRKSPIAARLSPERAGRSRTAGEVRARSGRPIGTPRVGRGPSVRPVVGALIRLVTPYIKKLEGIASAARGSGSKKHRSQGGAAGRSSGVRSDEVRLDDRDRIGGRPG